MVKACVRQCRERAEDVPMLFAVTVGGFGSPDADEDGRVDAEFFPDRVQSGGPLRRFV